MSLASYHKQHRLYKKGNIDIINSNCEILLEANFDHELTFDDHISELYKIASRKNHALARVTPYTNLLLSSCMDVS